MEEEKEVATIGYHQVVEDNTDELKRYTSPSGMEYVVFKGHKIRNSDSRLRLTEEEESYEEYKMRLKMLDRVPKKKPTLVWPSRLLGTLDHEKVKAKILAQKEEKEKQLTEEIKKEEV